MVVINLLPWRQLLKAYQEKKLKQMLVLVFCLSCAVVFIAHYVLLIWIDDMHMQMTALKQEWQRLVQVQQLSRSQDNERVNKKKWCDYRDATLRLFAELGKHRAVDICFVGLARKQNEIIFSGNVSSMRGFTEFIQAWPLANLFAEMRINHLQQDAQYHTHFRFTGFESEKKYDAI